MFEIDVLRKFKQANKLGRKNIKDIKMVKKTKNTPMKSKQLRKSLTN